MRELTEIREEIDDIDKEIVSLFQRRMEASEDVAIYKIHNGKEIYDPKREQEKLNSLSAYGRDEQEKLEITELFECIMSISRKKQYRIRDQKDIKE